MAIPSSTLEINLDPDNLSIGDARLMTGRLTDNGLEFLAQFGDFLSAHSNWSESEIDRITLSEMREIAEQVKARITDRAVPLANETLSANGHAEIPTSLPSG